LLTQQADQRGVARLDLHDPAGGGEHLGRGDHRGGAVVGADAEVLY
jgi:hypothetical protein